LPNSTIDRRSFIVRLSAKGRTVAARVHRELARIGMSALKGVTGRELQSVVKVLQSLEKAADRASARKPE
jgi:DNA-binding MarR family transcriptional regulator